MLIFKERYAKYLSQHNDKRHYIINYNENGTFTTHTFENNNELGVGYGKYTLVDHSGECLINIKYKDIFPSPNKKSNESM